MSAIRHQAQPSSPAAGHEPAQPGAGGALEACRLERLIGRPASSWTLDDVVEAAASQDVRLVSLLHVGGDGWLKALDFVPRSRSHLRDILAGGERADGSSLFPGLGIPAGASDVVLRPRLESAFFDPFSPLTTLAVLCGHAGPDGRALPQSPDTIVRAAAERLARELGLELTALGEVEYFLGRRSEEQDVYGAGDRGYHATSPFVFGEPLRRRAIALLAEIGIPVKYGHSEIGYVEASETDGTIWEQHEIELGLAPLPRAADAVVLTHWVLRNLAHAERMRCSFEPIVRRGHVGTGLHFHLSPLRDGLPVDVREADGSLTGPAQWLIAGLLRFGGALMAFGNRSPESFVRLAQAKEAPGHIGWGDYDRRALIRLPIVPSRADGLPVAAPTVEFRLPDGSAHPHLLLAGVAQAMVDGRATTEIGTVLERARMSASATPNESTPVPRNFAEVAATLVRHRAVLERGGVFPPELIEQVASRLGGEARAPR